MPSFHQAYAQLAERLAAHYGGAERPLAHEPSWERMLRALLESTLSASRAATVIEALKEAGLLQPEALGSASLLELETLARSQRVELAPATLQSVKRLARWLVEEHGGRAEALADESTSALRESLRAHAGMGPLTTDAILLHGLGRPVYPLDRATYRILVRHDWLEPGEDPEEARTLCESLAPDDAPALARLAAWLEAVGKDFCGVEHAKCERCPLRPLLPEGGPRAPE